MGFKHQLEHISRCFFGLELQYPESKEISKRIRRLVASTAAISAGSAVANKKAP